MADNQPTQQTPEPKLNWLEEVKADAEFNFLERQRQEEARLKHEAEKAERAKKGRA